MEEKKIGIITFQFAHNFGAALQCWALQEALSSICNDVTVINYRPEYHLKQYSVFPLENLKKTGFKGIAKELASAIYHFPERICRKSSFDKFSGLLNLTESFENGDDVFNYISNNYDLIVCGSDQIWNYNLTEGDFDPVYFAYSNKYDGKRIGYSISVGDANLENKLKILREYTAGLTSISVREEKTCRELTTLLNRNIDSTPDPTLLIDKRTYEKIAVLPKVDNYILVYLLDENQLIKQLVKEYCKKGNYTVIDISPSKIVNLNGVQHVKGIGPTEFLGYINKADYIMTNSFHGTLFSILFNKQFVSLTHQKRGERIVNLLNNFSLTERMLSSEHEIESLMKNTITYDDVNVKIEEIKEQGMSYLIEMINK